MSKYLLVLNAGSSSLKIAAFHASSLELLLRGQVGGLGSTPFLQLGEQHSALPEQTGFADALSMLLQGLKNAGLAEGGLVGVGHRIVHGGTQFLQSTLVDENVLEKLDALRALAPLHLPFGLSVLRLMRGLRGDVPHAACFDTAFHATQPELVKRLPLPRAYFDKGYRRYGFHGLNYEHVVRELTTRSGTALPKRIIAAHLGSGASMCGILDGRSVATTMGFSTADGLVMGTRTGSIDPGVLVALLRDEKLSLEQLEDILYRRSGLLGLSGISADMKVLLESPAPEAAEAVDYYCHSAARHAASLVPALGGVDAFIFTGGVGENAPAVRDRILSQLTWLNLSASNIHVIPANEELSIARHVASFL